MPKRARLARIFLSTAGVVAVTGCSSDDASIISMATAGATTAGGAAGSAGTSSAAGMVTAGGAAAGGSGTAGSSSSAGAAGTSSNGGDAGTAGSSGSAGAGGGGRPSGPSAGCQTPVLDEEPQAAILHNLTVMVAEKYRPTYETRKYYTNLPQNFDPTKPYPMMFYGQGCGQTTAESGPFSGGHFASDLLYVQLIPAAVTAETVVPSDGAPGCFQAGKQGLADSPDGPYFDQVLAEIEQRYCVDTGKVYVAGWSSGAWLTNYLACARGNVITGAASGSGGLQHDHGPCTGGVPVMLLPGDAGSIQEDGFDIGAGPARDLFVMTNGCSATPTDVMLGNQTCQVYGNCQNPVAWCPAGGGHGGPLEFIADSAWQFWTAKP